MLQVASFHKSTNSDFGHGLRAHIVEQLAFQKQQQQQWQGLLDVWNQIEIPSGQNTDGIQNSDL